MYEYPPMYRLGANVYILSPDGTALVKAGKRNYRESTEYTDDKGRKWQFNQETRRWRLHPDSKKQKPASTRKPKAEGELKPKAKGKKDAKPANKKTTRSGDAPTETAKQPASRKSAREKIGEVPKKTNVSTRKAGFSWDGGDNIPENFEFVPNLLGQRRIKKKGAQLSGANNPTQYDSKPSAISINHIKADPPEGVSEAEIKELAESLKKHQYVIPTAVAMGEDENGDPVLRLMNGEAVYAAAKLAGLKRIFAYTVEIDDLSPEFSPEDFDLQMKYLQPGGAAPTAEPATSETKMPPDEFSEKLKKFYYEKRREKGRKGGVVIVYRSEMAERFEKDFGMSRQEFDKYFDKAKRDRSEFSTAANRDGKDEVMEWVE